MKRLYLVNYTYRAFTEDAQRRLVKTFEEVGVPEGVVAHYERLDGTGGFMIREVPDDPAGDYERTLAFGEFLDFEVVPITVFEDALPTILKHFG